jgi:hypothetical protein
MAAACYAAAGKLAIHWGKVSKGERGTGWREFLAKISALPAGKFWRMNQAGDLPHTAGRLNATFLRGLTAANQGRKGYTYTHHALTPENLELLREANAGGFTVNASTESERAADAAVAAGLPAVMVVPSTEIRKQWRTAGGNRVRVCPAQLFDGVTCATCRLCWKRKLGLVVAFIGHGIRKKAADAAVLAAAVAG